MNRRGFMAGLATLGVTVSSYLFIKSERGAVLASDTQPTPPLASGGTIAGDAVGREIGRSPRAHLTPAETWTRPVRPPSLVVTTSRDREEAARWIWEAYRLREPNNYDTPEQFHQEIPSDWQRKRSAYVWRTYGASGAEQVYVLPSRFVLAHPPFLPNYPNGFYRLDPACETDDAQSCIPPTAFFRILPAEEIDIYQPPSAV